MKKVFLLFATVVFGAMSTLHAEDYDRISASFDCMFLHANSAYSITGKPDNVTMPGWGINYIHGFSFNECTFVELGISFSNTYGSSTDIVTEKAKLSERFTNAYFQVPINFVRTIPLKNDMHLSLFAGVTGKYNVIYKGKTTATNSEGKSVSHTIDLISTSAGNMNKNTVWHRWQAGWQIGVGLNIKKLYVGLSGGTDFIPAYSHSGTDARVSSANLKLNIGYTFSFKDLITSPATPQKVIYLPKATHTH